MVSLNISTSILDLIGNTPLLKLTKVTEGLKTNLLVKCEHMNPSGSVKDRMALKMIEDAERSGKLRPGGMIVDSTTGNTGPALTLVGRAKGYRVRMFIPGKWGEGPFGFGERMKILNALGAEVIQVPLPSNDLVEFGKTLGKGGVGSVTELSGRKAAYDLEKSDPTVWWARQSINPMNAAGHRVTGEEIFKQTGGKVDAFVTSIGTGGTLFGISQLLKEVNPRVKIFGLQPVDQPLMEWSKPNPQTGVSPQDQICDKLGLPRQGGTKRKIWDTKILDELINVNSDDALKMMNRLNNEEGLYCGPSSGANVVGAMEVAKKMPPDSNVVTVIVDRRDRYLGEWGQEHYVV